MPAEGREQARRVDHAPDTGGDAGLPGKGELTMGEGKTRDAGYTRQAG